MEEVAEHDTDGIISPVVLPEPQEENLIISPVVLPEQSQEENQEVEESPKPSDRQKKKFKKIWIIIPLLGAILAIGGVLFMRRGDDVKKTPTTAVEYSPLPVRVTTAQSQPISAWVSTEGTLRAKQFRYLAFDVAGDITYITKRSGRGLREGDKVTKGELLAKIDDREELANVSKAEAAIAEAQKRKAAAAADVASAQSQVAQARSQVQQLQAQVAKAQSQRNLAQTQLKRYQYLFNEGAVATSEIDTRTNAVRDAEADIRATSAQVASAKSQIQSAQSQVSAAQQQLEATESSITTAKAQLTQAKVALEGTKLYAPFSGIVAYLNIREGEYYTPQSVSSQIGGDLREEASLSPFGLRYTLTHDVFHVLLGFDTSYAGEMGVAAFMIAQDYSKLLNVFQPVMTFLYPLIFRSQGQQMRSNIRRGKALGEQAKCLLAYRFEENWTRAIADIRAELALVLADEQLEQEPSREMATSQATIAA
ncbi:Coq4 family protein [Coleofasciculus sp. LEGE 07092]|uniref:Coq4 family protein n=2 Tax=unclassified Coleofasciculus TaxID=2692782 RepID=UPI00187E06D5|nr:Coq4 family protein [Coleofasciculus sp. LEGE 07092]